MARTVLWSIGVPVIFAIAFQAVPLQVMAASNNDPNWPCIQRKVDEISFGQMWPVPIAGDDDKPLSDAAKQLADRLALRRVDKEEAKARIGEFLKANPDTSNQQLGRIFEQALSHINNTRKRLIAGIGRYAHSQQERAAEINSLRLKMEDAEAAEKPDHDALDKLEESLDWNERIYKERETSLTYVCETPVLLEKRAYMIAQLLLAHVKKEAEPKN